MAATSSRPLAVGSAEWLWHESLLADDFVIQEVEQFGFSARNDMEWLDEHMADVFNGSRIDVVGAFKTPGRLRGKTPRTARKCNDTGRRAPLTDVFTSHQLATPTFSHKSPFVKKIAHFQVAEDRDERHVAEQVGPMRVSFGLDKENENAGCRGIAEDGLDLDRPTEITSHPDKAVWDLQPASSPPKDNQHSSSQVQNSRALPQREESQDTFVSANEDAHESAENEVLHRDGGPVAQLSEVALLTKATVPEGLVTQHSNQYGVSASIAAASDDALEMPEREDPTRQAAEDSPSSDASSTQRPVLRKKSSLTFASLPAREPLTTKRSIGTRPSGIGHVDQTKAAASARESYLGRTYQANAGADTLLTETLFHDDTDVLDADDDDAQYRENQDMTDAAKVHSKTSTQRLQERLALLGKPSAAGASKSIPSNSMVTRESYVRALAVGEEGISCPHAAKHEDNDESWIGPIHGQDYRAQAKSQEEPLAADVLTAVPISYPARRQSSQRETVGAAGSSEIPNYPTLPKLSTDLVHHAASRSEAHDFPYPALRAQPPESPIEARHDGPLSVSKAKLFSVLKSAKGIFASSASASAQAKMNTSSPRPKASIFGSLTKDDFKHGPVSDEAKGRALIAGSDIWGPDVRKQLPKAPGVVSNSLKVAPKQGIPKSGASAERSELQTMTDDNNDSHSRVAHAVAQPAVAEDGQRSGGQRKVMGESSDLSIVLYPQKEASQEQRPGELRRPTRVAKDPVPKARPAPVSIKLRGFPTQPTGTFGTAGHPATATAQPQEDSTPIAPQKQPMLKGKASTASLQTVSSLQSFKTAATNASSRPKALEAAARKKEQDEKEAQRKAEQKREMERRRAAKAEEERRAAEEQKTAERQANESKQQAQKQAADHRKAEAIRRNEQLRAQAVGTQRRPEEDQSDAARKDRQFIAQQHRSDCPPPRPASRQASKQENLRPTMPHVNPAKPPKRPFDADIEDERMFKAHPSRLAPAEQHPSKKRKTSEDSFAEVISRPTMAPPVRPSMMKKDLNARQPAAFPGSVQAGTSLANALMMKSVVTAQHHVQHSSQYPRTPHMSDLATFSTAKIPFADAGSSARPGTYTQKQQHLQQPLKTPGTAGTHKSSPHYPNGDSIELPEIATDSEDSDDDDFEPPDWANSPALRELLKKQQRIDPVGVFGPIAPLVMEEVFKGNKERQAKFRKRTSSANWNGPDRLTEEERRKDMEARERLERDGAWTYGTPT